jgi:hypothetical protein
MTSFDIVARPRVKSARAMGITFGTTQNVGDHYAQRFAGKRGNTLRALPSKIAARSAAVSAALPSM